MTQVAIGEAWIVDSHARVASANPLRYPQRANDSDAPAPVEMLLLIMENCGVQVAWLRQDARYGDDYAYLQASIAQYSDRFIGIGRIGTESSPSETQFRETLALPQMRGLEAAAGCGNAALDAACRALAISGGLLIARPVEAAWAAARYGDGDIRVVVETAPESTDLNPLLRLAKYPNTVAGLAGFWGPEQQIERSAVKVVPQVLRAYGPERCVWGSGFPRCGGPIGYQARLDALGDMVPDTDITVRRVMRDAAAGLASIG